MIDIKKIFRIGKAFFTGRQPIFLHFGITHRCNLSCKMCSLKKIKSREMSLRQLEKCANLIKKIGIVSISIGGGEPLLYDGIIEAVNIFSKLGIEIRLLTNGMLISDKKLKKLKSAGLNHISISLDTLKKEKQDYICNGEGTWENIIESINMTKKFFNSENSIPLLNVTVSKNNIEELPALYNFAKKMKFYVSFIPISFRDSIPNYDFIFAPEYYSNIDKVYDYLIKEKKDSNNLIFNSASFLEISKKYLKNQEVHTICDAGRLYFSLEPDGRLYICHRKNSPSINLLNIKSYIELKDIIKSKNFINRSKKFSDNCIHCVRPCWTEVSLFFHDMSAFAERTKLHKKFYLKNLN